MNPIAWTKDRLWRLRADVQRKMYLRKVVRENAQYDKLHRTDTARIHNLSEYSISESVRASAVRYEPVNESGFRTIIECLAPDPDEYAFVDIGSGKGKALLMAACYPFRSVVGVEFEELLHRTAENNIKIFKSKNVVRCPDVRSLNMDARKFDGYAPKTFLFVFNPFLGSVMRDFVANLTDEIKRKGHEMVVAYLNPTTPEWFERSDVLTERSRTKRLAVYTTSGLTPDPRLLRKLEVHYSGWK